MFSEDIFDLEFPAPPKLVQDKQVKEGAPDSLYNETIDNSTIDKEPEAQTDYSIVEGIPDPLIFATFFDKGLNTGSDMLYPWQAETLQKLGEVKPDQLSPFRFCLCAANGSGKDAFVIAPFAVWFICCKIKALVIITSASGVQLTTQTEKYIAALCNKVNVWSMQVMGKNIIKVRQRRITCLLSGSEIILFATDEGAKAEGFHPTEPSREMAIIVNEAKNVTPEIFGALRRCTGYNYWLNVSTPGEPRGDFFKSWRKWIHKRKVTVFDCLRHQSMELYEEEKEELGIHSPFFRSKWLAEFSFTDCKTVINQTALERCRELCKQNAIRHVNKDRETRVGLDIALSGNGDETSISAFKGNKQTHLITFRNKDATILAENIEKVFLFKLNLDKEHSYIYADDGGVGRAVIDILVKKGWININRVLNQSRAKRRKMFKNRGAEIWYKFAKLIEHNTIILLDDNYLYEQLSSRKFKESTEAGIDLLTLQSKKSVMAEGLPSPDRADSTVLALCDYEANDLIDKVQELQKPSITESHEQLVRRLQYELKTISSSKQLNNGNKKARFSLDVLVSSKRKHDKLNSMMRD